MKKFIITFKNVNNKETLDNLFETVDMFKALDEAKDICENFKKNGFSIKVISIHEIEEKNK